MLATGSTTASEVHVALVRNHLVNPECAEQVAHIIPVVCRFLSLNPHSAALLASQRASLQQLLQLDLSAPNSLLPALALVPKHSLELFVKCASYGTPVLGVRQAVERQDQEVQRCQGEAAKRGAKAGANHIVLVHFAA